MSKPDLVVAIGEEVGEAEKESAPDFLIFRCEVWESLFQGVSASDHLDANPAFADLVRSVDVGNSVLQRRRVFHPGVRCR